MRSRPTQVEEKQKKTKKRPSGEWRGAPGKLSTLFSAGTPGASVIYGPCQVEGGEKKRARGRACPWEEVVKLWGRGKQQWFPELSKKLLRTHSSPITAAFQQEWEEEEEWDQLSEWMFCLIWGHRFFQLFNTLKGTHWLSLLGGPWRERGRGRSGLERPVGRRGGVPSLGDSCPFPAAPPCLCQQCWKHQAALCTLHLGTRRGDFFPLFQHNWRQARKEVEGLQRSRWSKWSAALSHDSASTSRVVT